MDIAKIIVSLIIAALFPVIILIAGAALDTGVHNQDTAIIKHKEFLKYADK